MSDYTSKQDLKNLSKTIEDRIDRAVEDLSEIIAVFAKQVDQKFNKVEADILDLKYSVDKLQNSLDIFLSR